MKYYISSCFVQTVLSGEMGGSEGMTDTDEKKHHRGGMDRGRGAGEGGRDMGDRENGQGGSYVNLFAKGINAHGEGGEEEGWREGMDAGDGGRRKTFRNLHAS